MHGQYLLLAEPPEIREFLRGVFVEGRRVGDPGGRGDPVAEGANPLLRGLGAGAGSEQRRK
jgi:hypothetical protein